jgi:hypothetical protein
VNWGVDQLVTMLHDPHDSVVELVLSVLDEASKSQNFLEEIVRKVDLKEVVRRQHFQAASNLLLRFVSVDYGLLCLEDTKWLSTAIDEWYVEEHIKYVHVLEGAITEALHKNRPPANGSTLSAYYDNDLGLGKTFSTSGRGGSIVPAKPVPVPVHVPLSNCNERPKMKNKKGKSNGMAAWSLEWLFRLPWNIKVLVQSVNGTAHDLTIDTYVDASQLRPEEHYSSDQADHQHSILVKGVVLNAQGIPQAYPVDVGQMLKSALFLGIRPVDKNGFTQPEPQNNGGFYVSRRHSVSAPPGGSDSRGGKNMTSDIDEGLVGGSGTREMYQYGAGTAVNGPESDTQWCRCTHDDRMKQMSIVGEQLQMKQQPMQQQQQHPGDGGQFRENLSEVVEAYGKSNCIFYPAAGELHICGLNQRAKWVFEATREEILHKRMLRLKSIEMVLDLVPQRPPAVPLRSHLYSELAATETGCLYLKKSGHVVHFIETALDIKKHLGQLGRDPTVCNGQMPSSLLARRAALWSVGHIASSDTGFGLLEECFAEVVKEYGEKFIRKLCNVSAMETEAEMQWRKDSIKIPGEADKENKHGTSGNDWSGNDWRDHGSGSSETGVGKQKLSKAYPRTSNVAANVTFGISADQIVDDIHLGLNAVTPGVNPLFGSGGNGGISPLTHGTLTGDVAGQNDDTDTPNSGIVNIDLDDGASSSDDVFEEDLFERAVEPAAHSGKEAWAEQLARPFTIVQYMVNLVEHSTALSIRGTCVFVLGLTSMSHRGRQALRQCGWDTHSDDRTAISVPENPAKLFHLSSYYFAGSPAESVDTESEILSQVPFEAGWKDILDLISNLSNRISSKEAHAALKEKASKVIDVLCPGAFVIDSFRSEVVLIVDILGNFHIFHPISTEIGLTFVRELWVATSCSFTTRKLQVRASQPPLIFFYILKRCILPVLQFTKWLSI